MAFSHGSLAKVWVDGFPATGYVNDVSSEGSIDTAETTVLNNTAKNYIPGLEDATVSMSGFFDTNTADSTLTFEYLCNSLKRTIFPLTYAPEGGDAKGDRAYLINGELTSYSIGTTVDEAATVEMEFQSNTGLMNGVVILESTTSAASDADGTGYVDNTTGTTDGGFAVLNVEAVSGTTPTLDVKIQHTADDPAGPTPTWADLDTFTQVTTSTGSEFITLPATVNRAVRVVWTIGGTTPSYTFNVAFKRN